MKVVVCGSYGDMKRFREVLEHQRSLHGKANVFPTDEHLERSQICIDAHHAGKGETLETLRIRSELMLTYFDHIDQADLVVIVNEKNGEEHYGVGTMLELGHAHARGIQFVFTRTVTNANIQSLQLLRKVR